MVQICSSGEKKEKIKNIYHRHSHSLSLAHIKLTRKSLFSVFSPFVLFKNSVALMLLPPLLLLLFPSRISSFQNKSILLTRKSFSYTHKKISSSSSEKERTRRELSAENIEWKSWTLELMLFEECYATLCIMCIWEYVEYPKQLSIYQIMWAELTSIHCR